MSVILSNGLLAASLLLGQPARSVDSLPAIPAVPVVQEEKIVPAQSTVPAPPTLTAPQQTQPTQPNSRPIINFFTREDRPILSKIQGWFKRDDPQQSQQPQPQPYRSGTVIRESTPATPASGPITTPPATDFPRRMPNPASQANPPAAPLSKEAPVSEIQQASMSAAPKTAKSPIRPELANKIGRDEKFEWITGQLEIENGSFVLYYATPETVDKFHGRIVLVPDKTDLKQFKRGDLVSVHGDLIQRQTIQGNTPSYHVTMASLIDHTK